VRLMAGWDAALVALLRDQPVATVLSAPAAADAGVPAFPTLRRVEGERIARGAVRRFEGPAAAHVVPSVCWCTELTAARGAALAGGAWPPRDARSAAGVTASDRMRHVVGALPLVEADARIEAAHRGADAGAEEAGGLRCGAAERVGTRRLADDAERIRKFGSSRAARLAMEFA
jgi:hypothetical protein